MSDSLKFQRLDYVRCTNSNLLAFDQVGRIVGRVVNSVAPYKVEFESGKIQRLTEHELTLADPDVHTVLDQMDTESAPCITAEQWAKAVAPDPVNHPQHYGGDTTYEVIKVAEAWGLDKDAYLFNVLKYVARAGKKGDVLEDLEKGDFYLNRRIATIKAAQ